MLSQLESPLSMRSNSEKVKRNFKNNFQNISKTCQKQRAYSGIHPETGEPLVWRYIEDYDENEVTAEDFYCSGEKYDEFIENVIKSENLDKMIEDIKKNIIVTE